MNRDNETPTDDLIELGSISCETKGGDAVGIDEQGLRQQTGLSDD